MTDSLRIRLLLLLGGAILIAAVVLFSTSFRAAMKEANKMSDYHMQQLALALKDNRFDAGIDWYALPDDNTQSFDFVIQFWSTDGARVYQSRNYTELPRRGELGYSTVTLANGDWRLYVVESQARMVQIAQKMEIRRERAAALAFHAVWPVFPVSLFLFLAAWWVVTSALSPLNRIAGELGSRTSELLEPVSTVGVPREIALLVAELNSLIVRMKQALQTQQRFLADAAHEMRSPLTALRLQIHTLTCAENESERAQAVARLEGGVERVTRLVEQLLALAKQDPQSRLFAPEEISLEACVDLAIADVSAFAASRKIGLQCQSVPETDVMGDLEDLRIMVRNLLDNAVRYTPESGSVNISLAVEHNTVVLAIADTGPGIAALDRERVFDRFYRVPGTGASGSGLGLAIVKAIAERHEAQIHLGDGEPNGLIFTLIFPRCRTSAFTPLPDSYEGMRRQAA